MQDNRKQVWGRRTDDQTASSMTKIKKNRKSTEQTTRMTNHGRTQFDHVSSTTRLLPELFKFAFRFEFK
jgi:hypothetical protein